MHLHLVPLAIFFLLSWSAVADESSRVFIYSQRGTPARSWMTIICDGEKIAEVKQGFFIGANVRPGRHSLTLADGVPISVEVRSGAEAFVRIDWSHDIRRQPIPVLSSVVEETARREMRFLSYVDGKRIHSTLVLREDPRPPENPQLKTRPPQ